jgi:hypothetical protein
MAKIIAQVALERRPEILGDDETQCRLEQPVERSRARERAKGRRFTRRTVTGRLHRGEHRDLMHQQW